MKQFIYIPLIIIILLGCSTKLAEQAQSDTTALPQLKILNQPQPLQPVQLKLQEIPSVNNESKANGKITQTVYPLVIKDRNGEKITFDVAPQRIIAFDAAAVEILFAIGQGSKVIATHSFVSYPLEVSEITKVGDAFSMDIEAIVSLNPDLVYIFYPTFKEELEKVGLKVLLIETIDDDLTKLSDHFRMWGQITDAIDKSENLASDFENRIQLIKQELSQYSSEPSIFQDVGDFWTPGNNTLINEVFNLLKLDNISKSNDGYYQMSPEVIATMNPQYIITNTPDSYINNPAFKNLSVIKSNSFYIPNNDYFSIFGPRFILGIEELANTVYPAIYKKPR